MMYRDWREVTKMLLTADSKGQKLAPSMLPKGKMKRKETKVYVKWVIGEIKKNKAAFDGYSKGHGIIRNRERFLKWFQEKQEGKGGMKNVEDVESAEVDQENKELEAAIEGGGEAAKVIIVPVAIPGCGEWRVFVFMNTNANTDFFVGKTSVALALGHLFGWGHTQSDNVKAKRPAPVFLNNVDDLLRRHNVVIADKYVNPPLPLYILKLTIFLKETTTSDSIAPNYKKSHLHSHPAHVLSL